MCHVIDSSSSASEGLVTPGPVTVGSESDRAHALSASDAAATSATAAIRVFTGSLLGFRGASVSHRTPHARHGCARPARLHNRWEARTVPGGPSSGRAGATAGEDRVERARRRGGLAGAEAGLGLAGGGSGALRRSLGARGTLGGQAGRGVVLLGQRARRLLAQDRKSTRLNSSHVRISYAVFCLKKKTTKERT